MNTDFEGESFDTSGPLDLTRVDWTKPHHRRSVAACLVQGVYVLEGDRQKKRAGGQALAPRWWEFFHFRLQRVLTDNADFSIIGAVFEYKHPSSSSPVDYYSAGAPLFVVAFRGNLIKAGSFIEDLKADLKLFLHWLPSTSRFSTAMKAVRETVQAAENAGVVWLAGHSLGSAIALLAGKNMAREKLFLESFLFNPPHLYAPLATIKKEKLKDFMRLVNNVVATGVAMCERSPQQLKEAADSFAALSGWVPRLFVNKADLFCSEYIQDVNYRKKMQNIGLVDILRIGSQYSLISFLTRDNRAQQAEPFHLIPSANLTTNPNRIPPGEAHRVSQWWKHDMILQSEVCKFA